MQQDSGATRDRGEERGERERVYRVSGLADLLPDWVLPPEGKDHVRAARKELLLAARSALDAWIERVDRGTTVRRSPKKIEID